MKKNLKKVYEHSESDLCECGKEIWEEDCDECYWKCIRKNATFKPLNT